MKKLLLFLAFPLSMISVFAQNYPNRYVAFLSDKNNSPWSLSNPSEFLSERAVERRIRYGIAVDQLDLPVNPAYISQIAGTGAAVINTSRWFNSVTFAAADTTVVLSVGALPFVDSVQVVATVAKSAVKQGASGVQSLSAIPPFQVVIPLAQQVKSSRYDSSVIDYGLAENQTTMINLQQLHNLGFQGQGMLIAVIDAGFANVNNIAVFDSLWINNRILGWRDLSVPGNDVFALSMNSHGTSVLSVMGGNLPGQMVGTAPMASYYLIRTEEGSAEMLVEEYNWAAGAELADSLGVDVINSSLGYTTFDDPRFDHSYSDMDGNTTPVSKAAGIAATRGMVVVNSAGNSGGGGWQFVGAPADVASVFTIGAVDSQGVYAGFSSTGPSSDGRIKPDVTAQGQATIISNAGGMISAGSGTSFSSPIMAGAVACLWQSSPERSPVEIAEAIKFSASRASNPDNFYGYGIPNMETAMLHMGLSDEGGQVSEEFRIVQNPVANRLVVKSETANGEIHGFSLVDLYGNKTIEHHFNTPLVGDMIHLADLSTIPSGVYLLRLFTPGGQVVLKLVKV